MKGFSKGGDAKMKCQVCNGTGLVGVGPGIRGIKKCDACNGTGEVQGLIGTYEPESVEVVMRVDKEMLGWLDMKKFPDDPQELITAIREAVYLAYARI